VERFGEQQMSKGALLFAFNTNKFDYYAMAEYTAKRINHFLNIPVTIVTNEESIPTITNYKFDNVITIQPDKSNSFRDTIWFNKGRYKAFEITPYDETLLLDVDYMVNSDRLLKVFDVMDDFACHEGTAFMMVPEAGYEILGPSSYRTLWATVIGFKKTKKTQQIFECMKMVQENYEHYANIHGFVPEIYRNDYSLTLAHRIVNGHSYSNKELLPWNLMHIGLQTYVYANTEDFFNTEYTIIYDSWKRNKIKKEYITVKDIDFHIINKDIFAGLMK
jgi:hypothetical protein